MSTKSPEYIKVNGCIYQRTPQRIRYKGHTYKLANPQEASIKIALQQEGRAVGVLLERMPLDVAFLAVGSGIDILRKRVNRELDSMVGREAVPQKLANRRIEEASDAVLLAHAMLAGELEGGPHAMEDLLAKAQASMKDAANLVHGL